MEISVNHAEHHQTFNLNPIALESPKWDGLQRRADLEGKAGLRLVNKLKLRFLKQ